jgi:hypothetical protein
MMTSNDPGAPIRIRGWMPVFNATSSRRRTA